MPQNHQQSSSADPLSRVERVRHLCFLIWTIIGVVLLAVAVGYLFGQIVAALSVIGLAAFIVFVMRTPVAWLERHRVPRWCGSLVSYLGAFLLIFLILFIFIPLIWEQAMGLIQLIPGYVTQATAAFNDFYLQYSYLLEDSSIQQMVGRAASELSAWAGNMVSQSAQGVITLGTNVVTSVIVLTMSLIVGFWVLKDLPILGRELRILVGPRREEEALFITSALARAFGGYLRGITVAGLCTGVIAGIGYYFIGLPYPAVLGLLTGLMNFIPYIGPWIAGIVVALIGLFVSPLAALLSIVVTLLAQQITDNFITPRVMSSVVELHPAIVLVGVFAGGALGGILGLIIAIPLLSSVKSIFVYYFEKRTGRRLLDDAGAIFKGRSVSTMKNEAGVPRSAGGTSDAAEGVPGTVKSAPGTAGGVSEPGSVKGVPTASVADSATPVAASAPERENREE